jgi:hypothetical protein
MSIGVGRIHRGVNQRGRGLARRGVQHEGPLKRRRQDIGGSPAAGGKGECGGDNGSRGES